MSNSGLAGRDKEKKRMQMKLMKTGCLLRTEKNKVDLKTELHFGCSLPKVLYQIAAVLQDPSSTASKGSTGQGRVTGRAEMSSQRPCSPQTCTVKHEPTAKLQKPEAHFQSALLKWLQPRFIP